MACNSKSVSSGHKSGERERQSYKLLLTAVLLTAVCIFITATVAASDESDASESFTIGGLKYIGNGTEATVTGYTGMPGDLVIPSSIEYDTTTYSVTSIGSIAFYECTSLTSVTIPDSVTFIGGGAFKECKSLTSVTIPDSVTSIGYEAFYGCTSLTSVTIPDSVTSIGDRAFEGCTSLTSVTIGSSVTFIGSYAFYGCTSLTSVTIPNKVKSIGSEAFYGCTSLTSVTIGSSVTSIGSYAFDGCTSLTEIIFNAKECNNLSSSVFDRAGILGSGITVTFGDDVKKIPANLFYSSNADYSPNIVSVTIGSSVTSIGNDAFYGCTSLTSVIIGSSVTSIGSSAFYRCTSLTSVTLPDSVTSIGDYAFYGCTSLTSVTIGSSVTSIGDYAFYWCTSLTSVTIGSSATSIGYGAFYGCTFYDSDGITEITSYSDLPGYSYIGDSPSKLIRHDLLNVFFNANGGSVNVESMHVDDGKTFILPECSGTEDGMVFDGWLYGDNIYRPGQEIDKSDDRMEFVAVWTSAPSNDGGMNIGLIIGGAVAGIVAIAAIVFFVMRSKH